MKCYLCSKVLSEVPNNEDAVEEYRMCSICESPKDTECMPKAPFCMDCYNRALEEGGIL